MDFIICSAVAHLQNKYPNTKDWLPSQIKKYLEKQPGPHQLMIYLKALRVYQDENDLKNQVLTKLTSWIDNPVGTVEAQINIWARLITRMQWVPELTTAEMNEKIVSNFTRTLDAIHGVYWSYSPMILEAAYLVGDKKQKDEIVNILVEKLAPAGFIGLREIFDFLFEDDDALEEQSEVRKVKEKCKASVSRDECKECMTQKKGDCWIRILSKVTNTEPKLHSGSEVADKVIYSLQQGIYVVVKAEEIQKQTGEGDVLFRQCVSLFSVDHALILYLNPFDTAPIVIEGIKKAASASKTNPRFEVIDAKYVRQIYACYSGIENKSKHPPK